MTITASNPSGVPVPADEPGESSIALRQQGLQRLQAGGFAQAIELLGRARALDPDDMQTQLNLGVALQGAGRQAEALEHFGQVQKSLPNDPAPFLHAAMSLLALGKAEAALHAAGDACLRAPQLPQALYAYGQALLALDKPEQAEHAFAYALLNAPGWADAWVNCGVARYRQGAIDSAKAAMRQALDHAPGHAAARRNLATLLRMSADAETNVSVTPEARTDAGLDRQRASDNATLSAWKPNNPAVSLGLAVEYLRKKPAFAKLPFGEWSQVLVGQVNRGHFFFVIDQHRRILGFLGWALTQQHLAQEWLEGRSALHDRDCREGECVILNAWAADTDVVVRFMLDAARKLFGGKHTAVYFKRHYPDGRTRPMRLAGTDFVSSHVARAAARLASSTTDPEMERRADAKLG